MENPDQGVIDFLSEQLKRKEDERQKTVDRLVQTYRSNLGILLSTWRFILVTRTALFALTAASLQYILQNMKVFLDTDKLIAVMEAYKGLPSGLINMIRLLTPTQVGRLVAILIVTIVLVLWSIDMTLALLQRRCAIRGLESEKHLQIDGLFFEIRSRRFWIWFPFLIVRIATLLFGIMATWYLIGT